MTELPKSRFEAATDSPWFDVAVAVLCVLLMALAAAGVWWVWTS